MIGRLIDLAISLQPAADCIMDQYWYMSRLVAMGIHLECRPVQTETSLWSVESRGVGLVEQAATTNPTHHSHGSAVGGPGAR